MKISCNISDNAIYDYSENERYSLGIKGERPLLCIGLNPSTACPNNYDNTMKRLKGIVERNRENYDSWIMLNIYPQRRTDPRDLDRQRNDDIHKKNKQIIEQYVGDNSRILCSWGASIDDRAYLRNCLIDIYDDILNRKQNIRYFRIGELLVDGNPGKFLFANANEGLNGFNMDDYINRLRVMQAE